MNKGQYAGMTVNERLFAAGLLDEFHAAIRRKNKNKVIELLKQTELSEKQAQETADALFANPRQFGY